MQTGWSEAFRKRVWQKIVRCKISNQASCLADRIDPASSTRLTALADKVGSGDPANIEAQAARDYWPRLFGPTFRRHAPDTINAALNYAYAVLRAMIARSQIAYGLLPCFGLHHNGELNAFNLTDDVMEVARPTIDSYVHLLIRTDALNPSEQTLGVTQRRLLAGIGALPLRYNGQTFTLTALADKMAANLVTAIEARSAALFITPDYLPNDTGANKDHER